MFIYNLIAKHSFYQPLFFIWLFLNLPHYIYENNFYIGNILYIICIYLSVISVCITVRLTRINILSDKSYYIYYCIFYSLYIFSCLNPHGYFAIYNPFLVLFFILFTEILFIVINKIKVINDKHVLNLSLIVCFFGLLFFNLFPLFKIDITTNSFDELHVQSYLSSIINMLNTSNSDLIENQYGRYYLFFYALSYFFEINIESIFNILLCLEFIVYFFVFIVIYNRSKNILIPLLTTGALFYLIEVYRIELDSYYYYQHYPHRILAPIIALLLIEYFGNCKLFIIYLFILIISFIFFWNAETGVLTLLSYIFAKLISLNKSIFKIKINYIMNYFNLTINKIIFLFIISLITIICLFINIDNEINVFDKVSLYLQYLEYFLFRRALYGSIEFSAISIFSFVCIWFLIIWKQYKDYYVANSNINISIYFCCFYSLFFSIYWYLNGSWIISIDFGIYVLIALGLFFNESNLKHPLDKLIYKVGLKFTILLFSFFIYHSLFSNRMQVSNLNTATIKNISSVIAKNTIVGENVLILSDRNFLYLVNKLRIPRRFPSLTEMISPNQLENYLINLHYVNKVIIDPMPAYNRGIGLYKSKINKYVHENFSCNKVEYDVEICFKN